MAVVSNLLPYEDAYFHTIDGSPSSGNWDYYGENSYNPNDYGPRADFSKGTGNFHSYLVTPQAGLWILSLNDPGISVIGSDYDRYQFFAWATPYGSAAINGKTSVDIEVTLNTPLASSITAQVLAAVRQNNILYVTVDDGSKFQVGENAIVNIYATSGQLLFTESIASIQQNIIGFFNPGANQTLAFDPNQLSNNRIFLEQSKPLTTEAFISVDQNSWTLIRSNPLRIPNSSTSSVLSIEITSTNSEFPCYITRPTLIAHNAFLDNTYAVGMSTLMPEYMMNLDEESALERQVPDYPLLRYMDVATPSHNDVFNQFFSMTYLDLEAGKNTSDVATLSTLIDPSAANPEYFPWLLSITGNDIANPALASTPWANLPSTWLSVMTGIDPGTTTVSPSDLTRATNVVTATVGSSTGFTTGDYIVVSGATPSSFNGTFLITGTTATTIVWSQSGTGESTSVDGLITLVDTQWGELLNYAPDILGLLAYLRWIVSYGSFGNWAGTTRGLNEAIDQNLINDKVYQLIYNPTGSQPFAIKIESATADTQGGIISTENTALLDAVELARPAGFILSHECV